MRRAVDYIKHKFETLYWPVRLHWSLCRFNFTGAPRVTVWLANVQIRRRFTLHQLINSSQARRYTKSHSINLHRSPSTQ
eukprot:scaffold1033_cov205-Alexandrium_tamarense.AAC.7